MTRAVRLAAITIRRRWLPFCCAAMIATNALLAVALLADGFRS